MRPSCGMVVAAAVLRRWPGFLALTAVDGAPLVPERVGLRLERARARLAANPRDPAAIDRLRFLEDHLEELVFDITCRDGHAILRTCRRSPAPSAADPDHWSTSAGERLPASAVGRVARRI